LSGYNEIEVYIPRVLCQATSRVVSMHIAFSAVILTWPFKGLIDMVASRNKVFRRWETRAADAAVDAALDRNYRRIRSRLLFIPFPYRRYSGQSIVNIGYITYIVNTASLLFKKIATRCWTCTVEYRYLTRGFRRFRYVRSERKMYICNCDIIKKKIRNIIFIVSVMIIMLIIITIWA